MNVRIIERIDFTTCGRTPQELYRTALRHIRVSEDIERHMEQYVAAERKPGVKFSLALVEAEEANLSPSHVARDFPTLGLERCSVEDMLQAIVEGRLKRNARIIFLHDPSWEKERYEKPGKTRTYLSAYDTDRYMLNVVRKHSRPRVEYFNNDPQPIYYLGRVVV